MSLRNSAASSGGQLAEFLLDAGGDDDGFGAAVFGGELADARDLGMRVGIFGGPGEFVFGDVAGVDGALGGKQEELLHDGLVFIAELEGERGFPLIEVGHDDVDEFDFLLRFLVAALGFLFAGDAAFFERGHVGEDELGVDDLDVADRIDGAEFVDDVVVFETADDLDDGVGFADVGEELVAEAGAFGGAFDEAGDIDELDGGGHQLVGAGDFREHGEPGVRHGDDADVRIDGAEWIVRRLRLAGAGDSIEECRFSDVG